MNDFKTFVNLDLQITVFILWTLKNSPKADIQ